MGRSERDSSLGPKCNKLSHAVGKTVEPRGALAPVSRNAGVLVSGHAARNLAGAIHALGGVCEKIVLPFRGQYGDFRCGRPLPGTPVFETSRDKLERVFGP